MRVPLLLLILLAFVGAAPARAAAPPRPALVVALSMDQFSLDVFRAYRASFTGGLGRLARGRVFAGWQTHAATETCPGHSTLLTGDHPARTGIVANSWWDKTEGREVYCAGEENAADPAARTSARLRVDTLGDWMRRADPRTRVVSVSGKDRAAIMMAGHHPSAVYWWRDGVGFATSPGAGPAGADVTGPADAFNRALLAEWRAHPPELWPEPAPARCAALLRPLAAGAATVGDRVPPVGAREVFATPGWETGGAFAGQLRTSPAFDALVLRFAAEQARARGLGTGPATDLLAVSLSATDGVGHRFGPGGPEMCAHLAAVDAALGAFLAQLDALGRPYVVVLSADHGSIDAAERLSPPGARIDTGVLRRELAAYLQAHFGLVASPLRGEDMRQPVIVLPADKAGLRLEVTRAALEWLRRRPEVAAAFTADEVAHAAPRPGTPPERLTLPERFHLSFVPERSGDLAVAFTARATLGVPKRPGDNVAGHGSPWDYDRRVPILFWWPGVDARDPPRAIETVDIAPTLAAMVGLAPPPVDGRCIDLGQGCRRGGASAKR